MALRWWRFAGLAAIVLYLTAACSSSPSPSTPAVTVGQFAGTWFNDDKSSVLEKVIVSNSGSLVKGVFFDKCVQNPSPVDCETFVANGAFNGSFVPALYVNPGLTPTQYTEVTLSLDGKKLKVVIIVVGWVQPPMALFYHKTS